MEAQATVQPKEITVEAVITRADGTVEDLGAVAQFKAGDEDSPVQVAESFLEMFLQRLNKNGSTTD